MKARATVGQVTTQMMTHTTTDTTTGVVAIMSEERGTLLTTMNTISLHILTTITGRTTLGGNLCTIRMTTADHTFLKIGQSMIPMTTAGLTILKIVQCMILTMTTEEEGSLTTTRATITIPTTTRGATIMVDQEVKGQIGTTMIGRAMVGWITMTRGTGDIAVSSTGRNKTTTGKRTYPGTLKISMERTPMVTTITTPPAKTSSMVAVRQGRT